MRFDEAIGKLLAAARRPPLEPEWVPLAEASGRVLASAARAADALPRFDNSSMDGFAVAAARTARASRKHPLELPVAGTVKAGDAPVCSPRSGFAWEIMTGGPMPAGCDAVVRVEDVELVAGGAVLREPAQAGDYVRRRGADLPKGAVAVGPGTLLSPGVLMALAAAGLARVEVRRRPRVAVVATGRELVAPGCAAGPGQVHDASSTFLGAALPALGAALRLFGPVRDDVSAFERALRDASAWEPDLLLTTGAVSKGRFDFVTGALAAAGGRTLFHGVAMRPGKPILACELPDGPLVLGLPGNPVSTVVGLRFFAVPVLRRWLGLPEERPVRASLAEAVDKPEGLRCFYKARLEAVSDGWSVRALPGQGSFQVSPLVVANGWVVLPEPGARVKAGEDCDVYPSFPSDPAFPSPSVSRARLRRGARA